MRSVTEPADLVKIRLGLRKLGNRRHIRISIALQQPTGGQARGRELAYTDVAVLHALRERFAVDLDSKDARLGADQEKFRT
jgi:hypothetical protein